MSIDWVIQSQTLVKKLNKDDYSKVFICALLKTYLVWSGGHWSSPKICLFCQHKEVVKYSWQRKTIKTGLSTYNSFDPISLQRQLQQSAESQRQFPFSFPLFTIKLSESSENTRLFIVLCSLIFNLTWSVVKFYTLTNWTCQSLIALNTNC